MGQNFTDSASYRALNCVANNDTNGVDLYADNLSISSALSQATSPDRPVVKFQQQPRIRSPDVRKYPTNVFLDDRPIADAALPPSLIPPGTPLNGSSSVAQFYMLPDNITGAFALGSFSDASLVPFMQNMLTGLQTLKEAGATQLIVDVVSPP